jgi:hypothetical protein
MYNTNIYFGLGQDGFQVEFDNIHTLPIIYQVQKIPTHSSKVGSVSSGSN